MKVLKNTLLGLLEERGAPLSYYQLSRKLTNKKMHSSLPHLEAALAALV